LACQRNALLAEHGTELLGKLALNVQPVALGCDYELNFTPSRKLEKLNRPLVTLAPLLVGDREVVTRDRDIDRETLARHHARAYRLPVSFLRPARRGTPALHDLLRIEVRWLTADEPLERGDQGRVDG
jgi:hypothetical protein